MKFLRILAVVVLWAAPAAAQVSVSGNLRDISGTIVTSNAEVDFELQNYRGLIPRISGTTTIAQVKKVFKPDVNGVIHCVGAGCTDTVYQNSIITPAGTSYSVCVIVKGQTLRCNNYLINSAFDLNSAAPVSTTQPVGPTSIVTQCFVFIQASPATTWTITHNLNDLNVFVESSNLSGIEIALPVGGADISNPNVAVITWGAPQAGRALVCHAGQLLNQSQPQPYFISNSPNPAQSGILRLASTDAIAWRNDANTGDVQFRRTSVTPYYPSNTFGWVDSATGLGVGIWPAFILNGNTNQGALSGFLRLATNDSIAWRNGANTADATLSLAGATGNIPANTLTHNSNMAGIWASFFAADGTASVAAGGQVRLANTGSSCWRNNANNADLCFGKNSSDYFTLAGSGLFVGGASSSTAAQVTPTSITGQGDQPFTVQSQFSSGHNGPNLNLTASNSDLNNNAVGGSVAVLAGVGGVPTGTGGGITLTAGAGVGAGGSGGSITLTPGNNASGPKGTTTMAAGFLFYPPAFTFATLGTPANGALVYCSDCTIANPCASGGTGAIAKRLNGVWVCN